MDRPRFVCPCTDYDERLHGQVVFTLHAIGEAFCAATTRHIPLAFCSALARALENRVDFVYGPTRSSPGTHLAQGQVVRLSEVWRGRDPDTVVTFVRAPIRRADYLALRGILSAWESDVAAQLRPIVGRWFHTIKVWAQFDAAEEDNGGILRFTIELVRGTPGPYDIFASKSMAHLID